MRIRIAALVLGALFVSASVGLSQAGAPHRPRRPSRSRRSISFSSPSIVDPIHAYGEPDARMDKHGTAYASGPWGTGTQRSIWNRSTDGGKTFLTMHDEPIQSSNESATAIPGPGGGDTEIAIDQRNNVFYADLAALASLKMAHWNNSQRVMETSVLANPPQNINGYDRQWFALWDPPAAQKQAVRAATGYAGPFPVNYLLFAEALAGSSCSSGSCESASYSTDGLNYSDSTLSFDMQNDGPLEIDQKTGTVFEAISVDSLNDVGVAIVNRAPGQDPQDPSLTKVQIVKVADLPEGMTTRALFPVIGFDKARNLYLAWVTRAAAPASEDAKSWQIFYSYSTAASGWKDWAEPRQISSPPSNTNVMPWAVAGSDGRLAVVWYGSDDTENNPSSDNAHQKWDVYLANITKADTASPKIDQIKVTRHPMHYGTVCLEGTGCIAIAGNRNLADFFEVSVDPRDGAIVIAYNDTSNDTTQTFQCTPDGDQCENAPDSAADHKGAPLVSFVRQNRGIGLYGKPVTGWPASGKRMRDKRGDALWDPIYGDDSVPQLDMRGVSIRRVKKNLVVKMKVSSLEFAQSDALSRTGSAALDWVARWSGKVGKDDTLRNPLFYVGAESTGGDPIFFAGEAYTYELCSVSGCFPHGFMYPAPPTGGQTVPGKAKITKGPKPDVLIIKVPMSVVHAKRRSKLASFSAFSFAAPRSATTPPTNSEAEGDRMPVMVDGICCRESSLRRR